MVFLNRWTHLVYHGEKQKNGKWTGSTNNDAYTRNEVQPAQAHGTRSCTWHRHGTGTRHCEVHTAHQRTTSQHKHHCVLCPLVHAWQNNIHKHMNDASKMVWHHDWKHVSEHIVHNLSVQIRGFAKCWLECCSDCLGGPGGQKETGGIYTHSFGN